VLPRHTALLTQQLAAPSGLLLLLAPNTRPALLLLLLLRQTPNELLRQLDAQDTEVQMTCLAASSAAAGLATHSTLLS
jgi:hypothetical protein